MSYESLYPGHVYELSPNTNVELHGYSKGVELPTLKFHPLTNTGILCDKKKNKKTRKSSRPWRVIYGTLAEFQPQTLRSSPPILLPPVKLNKHRYAHNSVDDTSLRTNPAVSRTAIQDSPPGRVLPITNGQAITTSQQLTTATRRCDRSHEQMTR